MGFLAGILGGAGQVAGQTASKLLDLRTVGYKGMADMYGKLADSYKDNPALFGEYSNRAMTYLKAASNPFDKTALGAVKGMDNASEPLQNFLTNRINTQHTAVTGQPAPKENLPWSTKNTNVPGVSPQPDQQPQGQQQPNQQAAPPQNMPPPSGSGMGELPAPPVQTAQAPQQEAPQPQGPPPQHSPLNWWDDYLSHPENRQEYDNAGHLIVSDRWKEALALHLSQNSQIAQRLGTAEGVTALVQAFKANGMSLRDVDLHRIQRGSMGDTSPDQYRAGSWKDPVTGAPHAHEMVTLSGGHMFAPDGSAIPPTTAVDFTPFKVATDAEGNLIDLTQAKGPVKRGALNRSSQHTIDPITGGSSTVSTADYGTAGGSGSVGKGSRTGALAIPPPPSSIRTALSGPPNTATPTGDHYVPDNATVKGTLNPRVQAVESDSWLSASLVKDLVNLNKQYPGMLNGPVTGRLMDTANKIGSSQLAASGAKFTTAEDRIAAQNEATMRALESMNNPETLQKYGIPPGQTAQFGAALGKYIFTLRNLGALDVRMLSGSANGIYRMYQMMQPALINITQDTGLQIGHMLGLTDMAATRLNDIYRRRYGYLAAQKIDPQRKALAQELGMWDKIVGSGTASPASTNYTQHGILNKRKIGSTDGQHWFYKDTGEAVK